jgi:hypothetical protein
MLSMPAFALASTRAVFESPAPLIAPAEYVLKKGRKTHDRQ